MLHKMIIKWYFVSDGCAGDRDLGSEIQATRPRERNTSDNEGEEFDPELPEDN